MAGMYGPMLGWPSPNTLGRNILEGDPDAAYNRLMSQLGLETREDPWARWARSQKSQTYDRYVGYASEHPEIDYVDYLSGYKPELESQYNALPSVAKGFKYQGGLGKLHWSGF